MVLDCVAAGALIVQDMTLKEAEVHALTIMKQIMKEKLTSTNVEVRDGVLNI
jgi:hypothetical protein